MLYFGHYIDLLSKFEANKSICLFFKLQIQEQLLACNT